MRGRKTKAHAFTKGRLLFVYAFILLAMSLVSFRVAYIVTIHGDEYSEQAEALQKAGETISAKRGEILSREGKTLALSGVGYSIYLRTETLDKNASVRQRFYEKKKKQLPEAIDILSKTLDMKREKIEKLATTKNTRALIKKAVDLDTKEKIVAEMDGNEYIEIEENYLREYPLKSFAAHLIGTVNDDGNGVSGIEAEYNKYLKGIPGKKIAKRDANGEEIISGNEEDFPAKNGANVFLTIDENLQYKVEEIAARAYKKFDAQNVNAIVMDVKTGDVLSMVSYPNFDLNEPGKPTESSEKKKFNKLSAKKQTEYVMDMWRNKNILSTYDPGSIFKLITAASAIENNAVAKDAQFYCAGVYGLYDRKIRCWDYPNKHGYQNLREGVKNSCNPVMIQVVQKLGLKKFYQYLELFGITEKTGIDYPAEAEPLVQTEEEAGPVGLATMSFGQGLSITPIQMVTAIASMGNDGKLMRPNLVKKVVDADGKTVYERKPEIIRQVVSQSTAKEVQDIMVYVAKNSIKKGLVEGYTVGGKTGTTQKLTDEKKYSKNAVISSVVEMAPMESPKYLCYIQIDDPIKGFASTGESTGPFAGEMMKEVLG